MLSGDHARTVAIDFAVGSDARFFAAHLRARVDFVFAGFVGEIGDPFAVRRPRRAELVNAGMFRRESADAAVLGGNGEDVAASFHDRARAGGRDCSAADVLSDALKFRTGFDVFGADHDGKIARFAAIEIVFVEQAAVFVDDGIRAEAGPLDVELLVVGEFFGLLGGEVVAVEIHDAIAVADEIDGVAVPHGEHVHASGFRQLFVGIFFQVVDGDREAPAAAIALPGAEFLRSFEIGDFCAVGREGSEVAARNGQWVRCATLGRDEKEARVAAQRSAKAVGAEEDVLAVGRPAEDDIVRRMKSESLGLAAFCGNDVDVRIAVVLAGEGDPLAIGRKFRVELVAGVRRQPPGGAAFARGDPQVAGVGKNNLIFRDVRESEKASWSRGNLIPITGRLRMGGRSRRGREAGHRGNSQPQKCVKTRSDPIHSCHP